MASKIKGIANSAPKGKKPSTKIVVTVRNDTSKKKTSDVDFTFLQRWLKDDTFKLVDALTVFSRPQSSSTPIYSVRKILQHWCGMCGSKKAALVTAMDSLELEKNISLLRSSFFELETKAGLSLRTTYSRWSTFLKFIEVSVQRGVLASVRVGAPAVISPPSSEINIEREDAFGELKSLAPTFIERQFAFHVCLSRFFVSIYRIS